MPPQEGKGQQSGILQALQNGVTAIRDAVISIGTLTTAIETAFPPISSPSSSTTPPAGGLTFSSSQPDAFAIVTTSSGAAYRLALYPSS